MKYELHINKRAFDFVVNVIGLCRLLPKDEINKVLINQILRSVTSIGANLEEATGAHTRQEFINCTNIARREARETDYWLKLIYEVNNQSIKNRMEKILKESNEIISILTSSVKKLQLKT